MIDLGKKNNGPTVAAESPEKDKTYYPNVYVRDIDLGLSEEDVGKTIMATVKIKVTGVSTNKRVGDKGKSQSVDLDLLSIELGKSMKAKTGDGTQDTIEEALEEQKTKKGK